MDKEEIVFLANDVYSFKESLKNMTNAVVNEQHKDERNIPSVVHEHLKDVLRILKLLLEKYPELQSTEMLLKAQTLIVYVQSNSITEDGDNKEFFELVNQLATAFSVRVSEYLMGDPELHSPSISSQADAFSTKNDSLGTNEGKTKAGGASALAQTTFGVNLDEHLAKMGTKVPTIVTKCIEAIEEHGILVKGIYRVSGVKSRVERLCQEFEMNGGEQVDLSNTHPNVIANTVKLYLRQLPQPLFTFQLYPDFIKFAKTWSCTAASDLPASAQEELKALVEKLPKNYYQTLRVLMRHLKKVSDADNNMSPSNLGIVFGPTLLRTNDSFCVFSLLDTVHQTRVVELIIALADHIFPS